MFIYQKYNLISNWYTNQYNRVSEIINVMQFKVFQCKHDTIKTGT